MDIRPVDFTDEQVLSLLRLHLAGMRAMSPADACFPLDLEGLRVPEVTFVGLWEGPDLLGFGALKELSDDLGELKSMRTSPAHLRRGAARRILAFLLDTARERGYRRVSLETGSGPSFEPAVQLYVAHGFVEGDAFADYRPGTFSRFFHLDL